MESLDRRAEELTNARYPNLRDSGSMVYLAEMEGYEVATKEHLSLHQKSLELLRDHLQDCEAMRCEWKGREIVNKGLKCTCGLDAHKAHLSSLLGGGK